ncbi:MAG: deoxyhypusine synthase family protein, partial [Thermoplasmata archaeon]|nr:deoxyhypusine synthase family protein [Thermoplasmata archaeon]
IRAGFIDWIVSTGANLYHDAHFGLGLALHQGASRVDDRELFKDGVGNLQGKLVLDALTKGLLQQAGELALRQMYVALSKVLVVELPGLMTDGAGVLQVVGEVETDRLPLRVLDQLGRQAHLLLSQFKEELGVLAHKVPVGRLRLLEGVAPYEEDIAHRGDQHAGDRIRENCNDGPGVVVGGPVVNAVLGHGLHHPFAALLYDLAVGRAGEHVGQRDAPVAYPLLGLCPEGVSGYRLERHLPGHGLGCEKGFRGGGCRCPIRSRYVARGGT